MSAFKHRYRIEEDYFLHMADARGWVIIPITGIYFVCELPEHVRKAGKQGRFRVVDTCIGTYDPKVSRCFRTDRLPRNPDPRVIPWCDCCWQQGASA